MESAGRLTQDRRLHTLGLRAHRRGRRFRRLVLPLPRLPLRHLGPHQERTRAPQPRDPGVRLLRGRQAGCRLRESDGDIRGINTDKDKRWGRCISVQYGVWVKQKRAPQGFRLQRPLIDHKPRSKPDCCLSLGKFSFSYLGPCSLANADCTKRQSHWKRPGKSPCSNVALGATWRSVTRAIPWFGHAHRTLTTQGKQETARDWRDGLMIGLWTRLFSDAKQPATREHEKPRRTTAGESEAQTLAGGLGRALGSRPDSIALGGGSERAERPRSSRDGW